MPAAQRSDIFLTALGIVLTLTYAVGLLVRPRRRIVGLGVGSLAIVILLRSAHGRTIHRVEHALTLK